MSALLQPVLERLLREDLQAWEDRVTHFETRNRKLRVPMENTTQTLHHFNVEINDLYSETYYWFARARSNRDSIVRLLESVLKDYYRGSNPEQRKAGGYQLARHYPAPEFYGQPAVNLFDLEDRLNEFFNRMDALIWTIRAKSDSKVTNNSILKIDASI
jgi:hypothetical protein